MKKQVTLYTDGACSGNPGPGGWGAILVYRGVERELAGGDPMTTNNRMELLAVIEGLKCLKEPCAVTIYSDSRYLVDAINQGWAVRWKQNGWKRNKKDPALNPDLWDALLGLLEIHSCEFIWVKGHAENPYNNRCDRLAVAESQKYRGNQ